MNRLGALDAITREQLNLELLNMWHHGEQTVVFITHDITEAVFLADRVLLMSQRLGLSCRPFPCPCHVHVLWRCVSSEALLTSATIFIRQWDCSGRGRHRQRYPLPVRMRIRVRGPEHV
jgi:energy-coupling factor transporter ATP-binding protein EcfA2